jgi:plasmid stability protein
MAAVTIRNLPDNVHRALKLRAAQHSRSTEAEIRAILEESVFPKNRPGIGTALAEISRKMGLTNEDIEALEEFRDTTPAEPMTFD